MPFRYDMSLEGKRRPSERKYIKKVSFPISRYGDDFASLEFDKPVNEKQAIEAAEDYLSEPITEEYYESIRDNLSVKDLDFEQLEEEDFTTRGDLLVGLIFLESIDEEMPGEVVFSLGS